LHTSSAGVDEVYALISDGCAFLALLAIYAGLAAALGESFSHFQNVRQDAKQGLYSVSLGFVFLIAVLGTPLPPALMALSLVICLLAATLYALKPAYLPSWLWSPEFALRYLAGVMALIALWSLTQSSSTPSLALAPLALLSAILTWQRGQVPVA
jgi:hypothetical protein